MTALLEQDGGIAISLDRRSLLKMMAAAPPLLRAKDSRPPNILLVLSDDHSYSYPYLGAYGTDRLSTPNLDEFARDGMLFENAFTAAPQCVPSRTALMTGRSPVAARMGLSSPLPAGTPTVPEVLRTRGYRTGVCGRYFHLDGVINPAPATPDYREPQRTLSAALLEKTIIDHDFVPPILDEALPRAPLGRVPR